MSQHIQVRSFGQPGSEIINMKVPRTTQNDRRTVKDYFDTLQDKLTQLHNFICNISQS